MLMKMVHMFRKVAQRSIMYTTKRCAGYLLNVKMASDPFYFKDSKDYVRQAANEEDIVEMQRYYWASKYNPSFSITFVTFLRYLKKDIKTYYFVIFTLCHATEMLVNHTVDHIIEKMIYSHLKTKQMN